jgi:hypothetical protein
MGRCLEAPGQSLALVVALVTVFAACATPPKDRSPEKLAPVPTTTPSHVTEVDTSEPFRQHVGAAEIFVPAKLALRNGKYDLVVHFHGAPHLQEEGVARAHISAVVVSVNVGTQSGPYGTAFKPKWTFPDLLAKIDTIVRKSPRLADATRGRLALTAWSAGASSVMAILANGAGTDADAVLLADGLFTGYVDPKRKTLYQKPLEPVAKYAERARKGETLFVLTHTSIATEGYPGMPETAGELLRMMGLEKRTPKSTVGPASGKVLYEVHEGGFHVTGYDGLLAGDHISQIKHMDETAFSYLRARWEK